MLPKEISYYRPKACSLAIGRRLKGKVGWMCWTAVQCLELEVNPIWMDYCSLSGVQLPLCHCHPPSFSANDCFTNILRLSADVGKCVCVCLFFWGVIEVCMLLQNSDVLHLRTLLWVFFLCLLLHYEWNSAAFEKSIWWSRTPKPVSEVSKHTRIIFLSISDFFTSTTPLQIFFIFQFNLYVLWFVLYISRTFN